MSQPKTRLLRLRAACAILIGAPFAAAQTTGPANAPRATRPAETAPAQSRPIDGLNARDLTVDAVLEQLSAADGYIVQKQAKDAKLDTRVTVTSRGALTPEELIAAMNTALRPDGFTILQRGRTLLIVSLDKARKGDIPVEFGSDPDLIPENDNLITQVIPVKTLDAVKLKQDLADLVAKDVDFTSNAAGNAIIMTDTSANVRRIAKIVHALDQHQAAVQDMKVFHLKYADSDAAAKLVTSLFGPDAGQSTNAALQQLPFFRFRRGGGGPGGGFPGFPGAPPGGNANESDEGGKGGKIVAASDARTNTLVVTGPTDTLVVVSEMVKEIDSDPSTEQAFFMYRLRNGQAQNLQAVLNNLFGNSTSGTGQTTQINSNSNRIASNGNNNSGFGAAGSNSNRGGGNGAFGQQQNRGQTNQPFGQAAPPLSQSSQRAANQLAGQVYVVADSDTNSLLVTTSTKYERQVRDIIAELDRPVPQVLIKVLVAEVTHDNNADLGTDFSVLNARANGYGQSATETFGRPGTGMVISFFEKNLNVTLHALAQQNKLDVLSRPYILASDNQAAEILVGQEVPLVTSNYTTDLGQIVSNYQYQKVGIIVDVTPHINPDGLVTLDVAPEISQLSSQTVNVGPNINAPVIDDRSASSRVAIRDGQTIVIGGLMQDQKTLTVNKIPILGDIPVLKYAFSRTQVDKTKTELLIFLTPHVAMNPDALRPMSGEEMRGTKLTPHAVEPGMFQDHLKGMQRGEAPATQSVEPVHTFVDPPANRPDNAAHE